MFRLRVLPLIIVFAFTSIVVKMFDVSQYRKATESKPLIAKFEPLAAEGEAAAGAEQTGTDGEGSTTEGEAAPSESPKVDENGMPIEEEAHLSPGYSGAGPSELEVTNMSDMEKSLLENLAKRRKELESWGASIAMKENILNATEKKINSKMDELSTLKAEVEKLLLEYNKKENIQVMRLVKIYENMKPQDAANIFEQMDITVILDVIDNMKEDAAAKILAKMSSTKATLITTKLAEQRRLNVN